MMLPKLNHRNSAKTQGTPTMDAEQLQHVEHFFYAQLARDARLGYFDAERVLFIKKV